MNKAQNDDFEVEIDDDKFEIEIEDDTPAEDRGKPRRAEGVEPDVPSDDELEGYSDGVKKRISKLKYEFHEERRAKEEAMRIREEAIRFAEAQKRDADDLRKRLTEGQGAVVTQAKARVETQLDQAKAKFKSAYEAGDADAMLDAQTKLTELQNEMYRLSTYKPQPAPESTPAAQATPPASSPQVPKPPQRALEWAQNNPWFQTDTEMTGYAFGVHERLVKSGVDPNSETYYTEIDAAVRKRFADKFSGSEPEVKTQTRQAGSVVAPASRTSKSPRKIVLTQSAVALAKRLGLTPEQYAAQLMKEKTNG
ncbi:MAG TPA: hypothetical protein VIG24_05135 [Acidimicrobiia bacterium]